MWRIPFAELLCYFILPTCGLLVLGIYDATFFERAVARAPQGLFFLIFFANRWAMLQAYAATLYLPFRWLLIAKQGVLTLPSGVVVSARTFGWSLFVIVVGNGYSMLANTLVFFDVCRQSPTRVWEGGMTLMAWDYSIFGTYPPFALQQLIPAWLGSLSILAYSNLAYLTSLTLIVLLATRTDLFRRYSCAAILAFYLALPFWLTVPALSPEEMFRQEILGPARAALTAPEIVTGAVYSPELMQFLERLAKLWSRPAEGHLAVSSWPSMHIVWAFLILWFGVRLHRALAVFLIPFFLLNLIATVYTLQHYLVDLLIAAPVTALAILLAEILVRRSAGAESSAAFSLPHLLQQDVRGCLT